MRSLLIIILIFPCIIFAQESMVIKHLTNAINSVGAELNFFQDEKCLKKKEFIPHNPGNSTGINSL